MKKKNKHYIMDGNKIRMCSSNIAKMNLFEVLWYDPIRIKNMDFTWFMGFLYGLGLFILFTLFFLFYPISIFVLAWFRRHYARRDVALCASMDANDPRKGRCDRFER